MDGSGAKRLRLNETTCPPTTTHIGAVCNGSLRRRLDKMSPVARGASPFYIEKFKRKVLVHKWIGSRIHLKMQMRNGRVAVSPTAAITSPSLVVSVA